MIADRNKFYSVSELAREFAITPRAIRFYEHKGLLSPNRVGGNRIYDYRDKGRLSLILRLKDVGFALDTIKDYLDLYNTEETRLKQLKVGYHAITSRIEGLESEKAEIELSLGKLNELKNEARELLLKRGIQPDRDLE